MMNAIAPTVPRMDILQTIVSRGKEMKAKAEAKARAKARARAAKARAKAKAKVAKEQKETGTTLQQTHVMVLFHLLQTLNTCHWSHTHQLCVR